MTEGRGRAETAAPPAVPSSGRELVVSERAGAYIAERGPRGCGSIRTGGWWARTSTWRPTRSAPASRRTSFTWSSCRPHRFESMTARITLHFDFGRQDPRGAAPGPEGLAPRHVPARGDWNARSSSVTTSPRRAPSPRCYRAVQPPSTTRTARDEARRRRQVDHRAGHVGRGADATDREPLEDLGQELRPVEALGGARCRMNVGATLFTVTPNGAHSSASTFVSAITAPLLAL